MEDLRGDTQWELPPLILHPFADRGGAEKIQNAARLAAIHAGAAARVQAPELARTYRESRYSEFRMLCFIGKDVGRWIDQCMDFVGRNEELAQCGIRRQSFAALVVDDFPESVKAKLSNWGVCDFRSILIRAIGLNTIFPHAPEPGVVSDEFLRDYQLYAEALFACKQQVEPFVTLSSKSFHFELYASGEYSQMLEREWNA